MLPFPLSSHEILKAVITISFVNGIVDPLQRSLFAQSIASLAERAGLPPWFVELRHQGTHEHLPSLQLLRTGCQEALAWLHSNYWLAQRGVLLASGDTASSMQIDVDTKTLETIRHLLKKYKEMRKQHIKHGETKEKADAQSLGKIVKEIIQAVGKDEIAIGIVVGALCEVGVLVPSGKKYWNFRYFPYLNTRFIWPKLLN